MERQIKGLFPSIDNLLRNFSKMTLRKYSASSYENIAKPLQSREDLVSAIFNNFKDNSTYNIKSFKEIMDKFPIVQTANHQGISCYSQDVQGNLLFAIAAIIQNKKDRPSILPIFSCGGVSFDTSTNPKGVILSRKIRRCIENNENKFVPLKINIFPAKLNHSIVAQASAFDEKMIAKAIKQSQIHFAEKNINQKELNSLLQIWHRYCLKEEVLKCKLFRDQTNIINGLLWKDLFTPQLRKRIPSIIYIELEKVAGQLIRKDLKDQNTLIYQILFFDPLRESILEILDNSNGCWDNKKLISIIEDRTDILNMPSIFKKCGSHFFWGIDKKRRRFPFLLKSKKSGKTLQGYDCLGNLHEIAFKPDAILESLERSLIFPTIFCCFVVICFARAFRCVGGYNQAIYLPKIQNGIKESLQRVKNFQWAQAIAQVKTENYFCGLTAIMTNYHDYMSPAGAIEILSKGGLSEKDLEIMGNITVEEACLLGMVDIFQEHFKMESKENKNFQELENGIYEKTQDNTLMIKI